MYRKFYFWFILIFISCSSHSDYSKSAESGIYYSSEPESSALPPPESQNNESLNISNEISNIQISERKLIKEGTLRFETENLEKTRISIEKIVKDKKGYISRENLYDYGKQKQYEMVLRIPSNVFDQVVQSVSNLVVMLDSKDINVKDVSEEYVDVESRIKAKKEILNRYTELLKQAKKVAEMLDIEREIGKIQVELESLQGRLKYLQNQVSFSTLTVTFYEYQSTEFGFFKKIGVALTAGWEGLLQFLVFVFYLWPAWIILGIIIWIVVYYIKKKNLEK